jgi:hypothetical protein
MQQNALTVRRKSTNLTVLMAVSKFKAFSFRARARCAKTKYRKQIESNDRRWGGRRLKLSGRAVVPIPAGMMKTLNLFINQITIKSPLDKEFSLYINFIFYRNLWFIRIRNT